jgi:hypothetical protein
MLAQILLGGVMHVLDFLSDLYVILLWHWGGQTAFVVAGSIFMGLSPVITGTLGFNWLARDPEYGRSKWMLLLLVPFNVHTMVFGFLVLGNRNDTYAWEAFAFLKALHSGIEAMPLSVMVGVELLAASGDTLGAEIKWTSLALSVFAFAFACIIQSSTANKLGLEESIDVFLMGITDVAWMLISVGWTAALPATLLPGVAIGFTYACIFVGIYRLFLDMFDPAHTTLEFLEPCILPYVETLGFRRSMAAEVMRRERGVAWVVPALSFTTSLVAGGAFFLFDMRYSLPVPAAGAVRVRPVREVQLAVLRRLVLTGLCAFHLVVNFAPERAIVTGVCIVANLYFTLRARGFFKSFGLLAGVGALYALCALCFWPCVSALDAVLKLCGRAATNVRAALGMHAAASKIATAQYVGMLLRPEGVTLSDEEQQFFDDMEDAYTELRDAHAKEANPSAVELMASIVSCADFVSRGIQDGGCDGPEVLRAALKKHFRPLCGDGDRRASSSEMRAELATLLAAPPPTPHGPDDVEGGAASEQQPRLRHLAAPAAYTEVADSEALLAAPFHAVRFNTVANASIWQNATADTASYLLSVPAETADYFVSHCWADPPSAKSSVLRSFLFMQQFTAVTLATGTLMALTLIPGGLILHELDRGVPWWSPSVAAIAGCLVILAWAGAWHAAGLSNELAPWRWSSLLFWFDKCCIDQTHASSKKAGIAHLGDSLERSKVRRGRGSPHTTYP